ncbi:MAG: V-type ATP synthase subunit F [Planctomycetota bacterium]
MSKIAIIGEKDDVLPYQSIGVEIEPVKTVAETIAALGKHAHNPEVAIIFITENVAEQCLDAIAGLRSKTAKAITIIPTEQGSRNTGMRELGKEIARAVGLNVLEV